MSHCADCRKRTIGHRAHNPLVVERRKVRSRTPTAPDNHQIYVVLADVLDLDPVQTGDLIQINLKYSKRIQTLIDQGASDAILYHEIQKFSEAKDEAILAMLTDEQKQRYAEYKGKLRRIIEDVIQRRNR